LLPERLHSTATLDIAAANLPCRTIGGDFYDYLELPHGAFGAALGDVAGKGPPAALLAATVLSNFAAQAATAATPADLMAGINRALLRRAIEARFATMSYARVWPDGRVEYSNAGQEPPLVVRAGGLLDELATGGPVLGLLDFATYESDSLTLAAGDLLVMYSDGVTEARNLEEEEFGRDRLRATVGAAHGAGAEQVVDDILVAIRRFVGSAPQADDITVLVLRYGG
jgi:serine phosphatase RsbU (regulator of sigma subunit)